MVQQRSISRRSRRKLEFINEKMQVGDIRDIATGTGKTENYIWQVLKGRKYSNAIVNASFYYITERLKLIEKVKSELHLFQS